MDEEIKSSESIPEEAPQEAESAPEIVEEVKE